jgi:hypothetical protein
LVLRNTFKDKKEEWKMIEKKAVKWTKLQNDYDEVFEEVKSKFG